MCETVIPFLLVDGFSGGPGHCDGVGKRWVLVFVVSVASTTTSLRAAVDVVVV